MNVGLKANYLLNIILMEKLVSASLPPVCLLAGVEGCAREWIPWGHSSGQYQGDHRVLWCPLWYSQPSNARTRYSTLYTLSKSGYDLVKHATVTIFSVFDGLLEEFLWPWVIVCCLN